MTVYLKGNPAGYDWQAAALTEGDPDGCVIDGTTAWELFGNKVPGGQILFQGRTYTVRKLRMGAESSGFRGGFCG